MARIRTIKPELFKHEELFDLERETGLPVRLSWMGLFTCCDREGRFKWRPRQLKADILPYDDVDFSRVLDALFTRHFIVKYRVDSEDYGYIPSWNRHQVINNRESDSVLPEPNESFCLQPVDACLTRGERVVHVMSTRGQSCKEEGKGKEGKGKEENNRRFVCPDWISSDVWQAFEDMRKQNRKPLTDFARKGIIVKLEKWKSGGHNPDAILGTSIENSWAGVFEPKSFFREKQTPQPSAANPAAVMRAQLEAD